jgi:hypothetical protein
MILLTMIYFLLAACSTPQSTITLIPPTDIPLLFTYTLNGEVCTRNGPNEVSPGEYSIKLIDLTGNDNGIWVDLFAEGYTRKDILDKQEEPGDYFYNPDWLIPALRTGNKRDSNGNRIASFKFIESGEYIVVLGTYTPQTFWPCDTFFVVEE